MSCRHCGSACQGKLCKGCKQIMLNEKTHGEAVDDQDQWGETDS